MASLSYGVLSSSGEHRPGALFGRLRAAVVWAKTEWRARRATRDVESLSDAMLHDIGITRGEIDQAVRFGRGNRPRVLSRSHAGIYARR